MPSHPRRVRPSKGVRPRYQRQRHQLLSPEQNTHNVGAAACCSALPISAPLPTPRSPSHRLASPYLIPATTNDVGVITNHNDSYIVREGISPNS
uniref:Uncharacterized protein n=1 Tax=Leersia perrieri TaxID=77586 RepID=A0A0D9XQM4_9ORYZ